MATRSWGDASRFTGTWASDHLGSVGWVDLPTERQGFHRCGGVHLFGDVGIVSAANDCDPFDTSPTRSVGHSSRWSRASRDVERRRRSDLAVERRGMAASLWNPSVRRGAHILILVVQTHRQIDYPLR